MNNLFRVPFVILDFIIGSLIPPTLVELFPPDYFIFEKLLDFVLLILASIITGIVVAWFGHWVDRHHKRRTKRY